jgi:hypothetical protein
MPVRGIHPHVNTCGSVYVVSYLEAPIHVCTHVAHAVLTNEKDARQVPGVVWSADLAGGSYQPGGKPTSGLLKSQTPEEKIWWSIPCSVGVGAQTP